MAARCGRGVSTVIATVDCFAALAMTVSRNARTYGFGKMGSWGDSLKRCWGKWVVWRNENYILTNASASEVEGLSPSKKTSEV